MAQTDSKLDSAALSATALVHPEIIGFARKRMEALLDMQKEFVQTLEGFNRDLFSHAKAEAELVSEFMGKLTSVRSLPDATTAYHEWASREMELLAQDGRNMFANGEKLLQASRRLFTTNGANSVAN
jgi:hypothetical protein